MRVLVDTPIWSAAFRRSDDAGSGYRKEMERLVAHGSVEIIGPIRQELLSGIRDHSKYETIRDRLRRFPDLEITTEDYEEAAVFYQRLMERYPRTQPAAMASVRLANLNLKKPPE